MDNDENEDVIFHALNHLAYKLDAEREKEGKLREASKLETGIIRNEWLAILNLWLAGRVAHNDVLLCVSTKSTERAKELLRTIQG